MIHRLSAALLALTLTTSFANAQTLESSSAAVNLIAGGSQVLTLDAGPDNAGEMFIVLGSFSGTAPGVPLAQATIPLNPDIYFDITVGTPNSPVLSNSFGTLDALGRATITFTLPPLNDPTLPDIEIHHAAIVLDAGPVDDVSAPLPVLLTQGALTVDSIADGTAVSTATVDISGLLPASLSGVVDASVTIDGVPATISADVSGFDRFLLRDVHLDAGANALAIDASAPGVASAAITANVTHNVLDANNVVVHNGLAYATLGGPGLAIVDLATRMSTTLAPPTGSGSIDDVAIADDLLFVLDAAGAGRVSVFSLADPAAPVLTNAPVPVPVGPFAGVSAGNGRVVTSGGTSLLRVFEYNSNGTLSATSASADLGVGQPDVLVSADGETAFVSTDFAGSVDGAGFGITIIDLDTPPTSPTTLDRVGLVGSGFTSGASQPANFPIESALLDDLVLVAHGGGLSVLAPALAAPLLTTLPLAFDGTSVDVAGDRAYVVGQGPARRLARIDVSNPAAPSVIDVTSFPAPGQFTGVAADDEHVVIASNAGGLLVLTGPAQ